MGWDFSFPVSFHAFSDKFLSKSAQLSASLDLSDPNSEINQGTCGAHFSLSVENSQRRLGELLKSFLRQTE